MSDIEVFLTDPRIAISAEVEPTEVTLSDGKAIMTTSVEITVEYDLGHARSALADLRFVVAKLERKLQQAHQGEIQARNASVSDLDAERASRRHMIPDAVRLGPYPGEDSDGELVHA